MYTFGQTVPIQTRSFFLLTFGLYIHTYIFFGFPLVMAWRTKDGGAHFLILFIPSLSLSYYPLSLSLRLSLPLSPPLSPSLSELTVTFGLLPSSHSHQVPSNYNSINLHSPVCTAECCSKILSKHEIIVLGMYIYFTLHIPPFCRSCLTLSSTSVLTFLRLIWLLTFHHCL